MAASNTAIPISRESRNKLLQGMAKLQCIVAADPPRFRPPPTQPSTPPARPVGIRYEPTCDAPPFKPPQTREHETLLAFSRFGTKRLHALPAQSSDQRLGRYRAKKARNLAEHQIAGTLSGTAPRCRVIHGAAIRSAPSSAVPAVRRIVEDWKRPYPRSPPLAGAAGCQLPGRPPLRLQLEPSGTCCRQPLQGLPRQLRLREPNDPARVRVNSFPHRQSDYRSPNPSARPCRVSSEPRFGCEHTQRTLSCPNVTQSSGCALSGACSRKLWVAEQSSGVTAQLPPLVLG